MAFLVALVTALLLVVPVELPDKTFVATLVLATRYRPAPVWFGVSAAFGVQCLVAVLAGRLVSLLPEKPVHIVTAGLFALGGLVLLRSAGRATEEEKEREKEFDTKIGFGRASGVRAAAMSFGVLFLAEWGDLSQLLTAGLVAQGRDPVGVFVGAWLGLAAISLAAVLLGRVLLRYVSLTLVQYVGAGVCAVLAAMTLYGAFT